MLTASFSMQRFLSAGDLQPFVKDFVFLEDARPLCAPPQQLLPDGNFMLVFNLEGGYLSEYPHHAQAATKAAVGYLHTHASSAFQLSKTGFYRGIALHLTPDGLYHLLRSSLCELPLDALLTTEELFGKWGRNLAEHLEEITSLKAQIAFLEQALRHKFANVRYRADSMSPFLDWIDAHHGNVQEMATAFCMSRKTLERRFQQRIGLSPKQYSRMIRFRKAYTQLCIGNYAEMMDLVVENGYFDQMHMIKEFKQFVGTTPSVLINTAQQAQQSYHIAYRKLNQPSPNAPVLERL